MDRGLQFECKLQCYFCNKIFGWVWDRRSHCRRCCTSVCKECSNLADVNNRESRLCKDRLACERLLYSKLVSKS